MELKKIRKLRGQLKKLRAQKFNLGQRELERFAKKLGRRRLRASTSEPQWVSDLLPAGRPISIPGHKKINPYTAESILDQLEADLDLLEEQAANE